MRNKKIRKLIYSFLILEISLTFIIRVILDEVNKNLMKGIEEKFIFKLLLCSIAFSLISFVVFILFQYKLERKEKNLSCIYSPSTRCCLSNCISLDNNFRFSNEIITDLELAKYERMVDTKEIWLLSLDLSVEEGENVFKEVVRSRLYEGVHYSFIALNTPISRERAKKIKSQYKSIFTSKHMHFYLLNDNEYGLFLSLYALAIYNPTDNLQKTQAYVCVGETSGSETSIYAKLDKNHAQIATNITREIINTNKEYIP